MNTPASEALALHARACALQQQEALLPAAGQAEVPDAVQIGRQIVALGTLIRELGGDFAARAAKQPVHLDTTRAAMAYAEAVTSLGEASAALGTVARQLAFLSHTVEQHQHPVVRKARTEAVRTIERAVETAREELRHGAQTLTQTARHIPPPSAGPRQQAAASRSANATPSIPADLNGPRPAPPAPSAHTTRNRR